MDTVTNKAMDPEAQRPSSPVTYNAEESTEETSAHEDGLGFRPSGKAAESKNEGDSQFANSTFNVFDALFVLISVGLVVADFVTDMVVACKYFVGGDSTWGALTLTFLLIPSVIVQIFSIRWYLVDDDMTTLKWVTHICQVGPLHRYVSLFRTGLEARRTRDPLDFERLFYQQSDVCMLRLFESFLESAPQVVLQLYIMIATSDENFWTGVSASVSLISLCWALGAYSRAHRKVRRDKKVVSWPGLILQTIWRVGMISSRVMALVLFASVFKGYIFLVVGVHWVAMAIWVHLQKTDFCSHPAEERLFNAVVAVIYVFCFFNLKEGQSRRRVLVFYLVLLVEDSVLFLVWYSFRTNYEAWYGVAGLVIVFGGFGIGAVSMVLYYRYLHPRSNFRFCGTKQEKEEEKSPSHVSIPSQASSPSDEDAFFSPELHRHKHSPSPKRPHGRDVTRDGSPLAEPLCQASVVIATEEGRNGSQATRVDRSDSLRRAKSDSCVLLAQDERAAQAVTTPGNAAIATDAYQHEISGFGTELVQRFDRWKTRLTTSAGNESVLSGNGRGGTLSRSVGSMLNQSHFSRGLHQTSARQTSTLRPQAGDHHEAAVETNVRRVLSPELVEMPEVADSPNKIMTAHEAQQIYDSILGREHPHRSSKRKLTFDEPKVRLGPVREEQADGKKGWMVDLRRKVLVGGGGMSDGAVQGKGRGFDHDVAPLGADPAHKAPINGGGACYTLEGSRLNGCENKASPSNTSIAADASVMASSHHEISGFGTELVQRFDRQKTRLTSANDSVMDGWVTAQEQIDSSACETESMARRKYTERSVIDDVNKIATSINFEGHLGFQNQVGEVVSTNGNSGSDIDSQMMHTALAEDLLKGKEKDDSYRGVSTFYSKKESGLGHSHEKPATVVANVGYGGKGSDQENTNALEISPLMEGKRDKGRGRGKTGSTPAAKAKLKRVRSLKESVSHCPGPDGEHGAKCAQDVESCGNGNSPHTSSPEKAQTLIEKLRGKIRRALSVRGSAPAMPDIEVEFTQEVAKSDTLDITQEQDLVPQDKNAEGNILEKDSEVERILSSENHQNVSSPVNPDAQIPMNVDVVTISPAICDTATARPSQRENLVLAQMNLSPLRERTKDNEKRSLKPVVRGVQSPGRKEGLYQSKSRGSPLKSGEGGVGLVKTGRMYLQDKENRVSGGLLGAAAKQGNGQAVVVTSDRKPPRRSLNRIPTNLVADNVARFDSPTK